MSRWAGTLGAAWLWFVEGLAEAVLWLARRGRRPLPFRLVVGETEGVLFDPDGAEVWRVATSGSCAPPQPPDLARRLTGRELDLVIPSAWIFRRSLDPVAVQSRPFLDAFVRHRIERITPWRAEAVHHRVIAEPLAADATRLAVTVVLVPKRLVERWLSRLDGLGFAGLRLCAPEGTAEAIRIGVGEPPRAAALRRMVAWGLVGGGLATALACAVLEWQAMAVASEVTEQNRVLGERQVVLARARRRDGTGDELSATLLRLRDARMPAVAIIDALAEAVPDSAHLTALSIAGDRVTISGLSTDASALVPALERSGRFADVASSAATTRSEAGDADRFSLAMRVLLPAATDVRAAAPAAR